MVGLDNPIHLAFLLMILLLVFGAKRLPEMGRSLGSGLRGFKEAISGEAPAEPVVHLSETTTQPTTAATPEHVSAGTHERVESRPAA